jgi:peroxiredoxin
MKISFLLLAIHFAFAQQNPAKPKYVTIINNEIVTMEKVNEYAKQGLIKQMNKGVSEEERAKLAARFGNQIGDKEFIMIITLLTEEEKKEREKNAPAKAVVKDSSQNEKPSFFQVSETAKDFTVKMLDGKTIRLSDLKGKVVLLNFWATWCAPCLMEFYDIPSKIIEPFKNSAFVFLPISKGETKDKVADKMARLKTDGIRFNTGIDPDKTISNLYDANTIPRNLLIDQNGVIRWISVGNVEGNLDRLAAEIKKLLEQ